MLYHITHLWENWYKLMRFVDFMLTNLVSLRQFMFQSLQEHFTERRYQWLKEIPFPRANTVLVRQKKSRAHGVMNQDVLSALKIEHDGTVWNNMNLNDKKGSCIELSLMPYMHYICYLPRPIF